MVNYLKIVKFSNLGFFSKGKIEIFFVLLIEVENSIIVLCGKNIMGKFYIFRKINNCIKNYNKNIFLNNYFKFDGDRIIDKDVFI